MSELYREEQFHITDGPDGQVKELAIFPKGAAYEKRDFIWRLSASALNREGAVLDSLPDYDRVLLVLEGDTVLIYQGQRVIRLKELEQDRFDGGFITKSFGRILGYNLMVRKGAAGYLDVLELTEESQILERETAEGRRHACHAFYCYEGYGVITLGDEQQTIYPGEQLVIPCDGKEDAEVGVMGKGILIRAQIFYDEMDLAAAGPQKENRAGLRAWGRAGRRILSKLVGTNKKT